MDKVKRTRRRVEKEDFARILLTETSTYDVPILLSNLGLYWHWKKFQEGKSLFPEVMKQLFREDDNYTIPLSFKVRKSGGSFRTLALMHPRSQVKFVEFYKKFDQQVLLACQKSRFSIRFPDRIGSKYYTRNINENRRKYRSRAISTVEHESRSKYLTTYFSYRSHTRLHSFYDSDDFRLLEKKYTAFWSVDVSRCFESIYTHSITWALKNKNFAKNNIVPNTFGAIFDRLMQSTNYNETAGIVIGSEISRLFAEIIFQKIDQNVYSRLSVLGWVEGQDYTIRRYVDDIMIFAISEEVAKEVLLIVVDALREFKLNINDSKTLKTNRPFITEQSKSMRLVKNSYKTLIERLLEESVELGKSERVPKIIFNRKSFVRTYLEEVKLACVGAPLNYGLVAGYLISSFSNLLISFADSHLNSKIEEDSQKNNYASFFYTILEIIFHLYTVSPNQNGSIKIGLVIQSACMFFDVKIKEESDSVRSLIYTLATDFFRSSSFYSSSKDNNEYATIESLNMLAAVKILGENFMISPQIISKVVDLKKGRTMSYFEIITLLYYIGNNDEPVYSRIKDDVVKHAKRILLVLDDLRENSEKFHLLLDMLACPFVEKSVRSNFAKALWKTLFHNMPTDIEVEALQNDFAKYPWFTSWDSAEILNSLEKKALLRSY
jgi:hypothetical protein